LLIKLLLQVRNVLEPEAVVEQNGQAYGDSVVVDSVLLDATELQKFGSGLDEVEAIVVVGCQPHCRQEQLQNDLVEPAEPTALLGPQHAPLHIFFPLCIVQFSFLDKESIGGPDIKQSPKFSPWRADIFPLQQSISHAQQNFVKLVLLRRSCLVLGFEGNATTLPILVRLGNSLFFFEGQHVTIAVGELAEIHAWVYSEHFVA
jgi:hypothetical protein